MLYNQLKFKLCASQTHTQLYCIPHHQIFQHTSHITVSWQAYVTNTHPALSFITSPLLNFAQNLKFNHKSFIKINQYVVRCLEFKKVNENILHFTVTRGQLGAGKNVVLCWPRLSLPLSTGSPQFPTVCFVTFHNNNSFHNRRPKINKKKKKNYTYFKKCATVNIRCNVKKQHSQSEMTVIPIYHLSQSFMYEAD